jgi:uncharacterized membrane protein YeaQ/YmgE (transglycosylase-associated protein family)
MISGAISVSTITEIILNILHLTPFLLPILIGYFAERIFKTRLFGRLSDIIIGLIGGIGLYVVAATINSIIYNDVAKKFYADLFRRGEESMGKHPPYPFNDLSLNIIFTIAAVVGALALLYIARIIFRGRVQKISGVAPAPTVAMAPLVPMAPSVAMAPSAAPPTAAHPAPTRSAADSSGVMERIKKLAELHAAGILTDPEFTSKKAELLSRL